jgi:hypothetical protein
MNSTIGIINLKTMKLTFTITCYCFLFLAFACKSNNSSKEEETIAKSDVSIVHPVILDADITSEFQGITQYLQKTQVHSKITGIVTKCYVSASDRIAVGQPLFMIKPREAGVLEPISSQINNLKINSDTVHSSSSGSIQELNVQPGDFVQEGDLLATIIDLQSLKIVAYVPVEKGISEILNRACTIQFPDGKKISGIIDRSLPSANETDQTRAFLIKPQENISASENIHVTIKVSTGKVSKGIFLPAKAVFANEELSQFWVMKVINDSIAVKIPVQKGVVNDTLVQIVNAGLDTSDRIISTGGYALSDSALVNIVPSN